MDTQTQSASITFPSVVNLNVGGQIYTTSLATLTKYSESMLGAMFSGRFAAQKDPNGNYFIDRDGAMFRYILDFLRNGELRVLENSHEFGLLLKEAEFFQIPTLTDAVKQQMKSQDGRKSNNENKPEPLEIITVSGDGKAKGKLKSISGRFRTLVEMFHIGDEKNETFQVSRYGNQSDRTDSEQTCIVSVKETRIFVGTWPVVEVAKLHGFQHRPGNSHAQSLCLGFMGDSYWILSRPNPQR